MNGDSWLLVWANGAPTAGLYPSSEENEANSFLRTLGSGTITEIEDPGNAVETAMKLGISGLTLSSRGEGALPPDKGNGGQVIGFIVLDDKHNDEGTATVRRDPGGVPILYLSALEAQKALRPLGVVIPVTADGYDTFGGYDEPNAAGGEMEWDLTGEPANHVVCRICGEKKAYLSASGHLRATGHELTREEYVRRFPGAPLVSDAHKAKFRRA